MVWNGRFGDYDTGVWYHRKGVVNVANPADLFLRPTPTVCAHLGRLR